MEMASVFESIAKVFRAKPKDNTETALLLILARLSTAQKKEIADGCLTIGSALALVEIADLGSDGLNRLVGAQKIIDKILNVVV